jgi:regulator of protease activity HflC (stomatin/prohibitin superfamily)
MEYERGLKYTEGRFDGVLEPGRYPVGRRTSVRVVDMRSRFASITGQEVLTSDGVTLKLSIAARFEVADPVVAINNVQEFEQTLYLLLQLALREIVGNAAIESLLEDRAAIGRQMMESASGKAQEIGLKLLDVEVKDIMFPGDLKRMFAQVVQARKEGEAALERARGETAALRNLANAARMVQENPALIQLRLLQQVQESSGNTFVIGIPSSATTLPVTTPPDASETQNRPEQSES